MNLFLSNRVAPDMMPYSGAILLINVPRLGHLDPVVQNFVSLIMLSLSPQFVNYYINFKSKYTIIFC